MNVEEAKSLFTKDHAQLMTFTQKDNYIILQPIQFLGSQNFADIAEIIRAVGGDYVSAGKDSHFRILVSSTAAQATAEEKAPVQAPANLHFKITTLNVALGRTVDEKTGDAWIRQRYSVEVEVGSDEIDVVEKAKAEATQLLNSWLSKPALPGGGAPTSASVRILPEFNPDDLMKHEGWKGRRIPEGGHKKGSLAWGWDYRDQFNEATIQVLAKTGSFEIGEYEFTLGDAIVNAKKKK